MNCICNDVKNLGIYFIEDPDGYQLEILPENWGKFFNFIEVINLPYFKFDHTNLTVFDIDRSLKFYEEALGLTEFARLETQSYIFIYMGDAYRSDHVLELQAVKSRKLPYNIGDTLSHLAFMVDDFDAAYKKHKKMNCIFKEHKIAGLYWIKDPDGNLIEIVPQDWGEGFRY